MDAFLNAPWECDFTTHPPPENAELEGVLIETRLIPSLRGTLKNFSCMFPYAALTIFHSMDNIDYFREIIGEGTNIRFIEFPVRPFVREKYNYYLKSYEFYSNFTSKRLLLFCSDTGIRKNDILRYCKYDYIGAPWIHNPADDPRVFQGNGAFALRKTETMKKICNAVQTSPPDQNEDLFLCKYVVDVPGVVLPSFQEAVAFSTERIPHPDPLGFHNSDYYFREHPDDIFRGQHEKVYTGYEGPSRTLFQLESARVDDVDVTELVRLGIGPKGLRLGKGSKLHGTGSILTINQSLSFPLHQGEVVFDIFEKA
jgi:hypothetical protein